MKIPVIDRGNSAIPGTRTPARGCPGPRAGLNPDSATQHHHRSRSSAAARTNVEQAAIDNEAGVTGWAVQNREVRGLVAFLGVDVSSLDPERQWSSTVCGRVRPFGCVASGPDPAGARCVRAGVVQWCSLSRERNRKLVAPKNS